MVTGSFNKRWPNNHRDPLRRAQVRILDWVADSTKIPSIGKLAVMATAINQKVEERKKERSRAPATGYSKV